VDNILRPVLVSRGLSTPMPVILTGLIGGVMAHGIIGVFIGPIVLAVAWALLATWLYGAKSEPAPSSATSDNRTVRSAS
jgi:predicted PurR-regulated permease PerM